ncbi:MAG: glycosyltransferase family 2 protein [Acidimicrobiia bacterium]
MTQPRVTVAIPTWNRAELLRGCIESVQAQTFTDWEMYVLDNCSDDHTPDVVAEYMKADPRIHYIRNDENIGHWRNETKGLAQGVGEYVMVQFDDDRMLPRNLERKVAMMDAHPNMAMIHSSFHTATATGEVVHTGNWAMLDEDTVETSQEYVEKSLLTGCRAHVSAVMFRRTAVVGDGFFESDAPCDDHVLWLRAAMHGEVGFINEPLIEFRMYPGWSTETGYQEIENGAYKPTFVMARGLKRVVESFIGSQQLDAATRRRWLKLARVGRRRQIIVILRRLHPDFRPLGASMKDVVTALRIEPSIVLSKSFPTVFLPKLRPMG